MARGRSGAKGEAKRRREGRQRPAAASVPRASAPAGEPNAATRIAVKATPWLWHLAAAATIWLLQFQVLFNSDIWFHLAAGRLIVHDRAVPAVDSWSFTAFGQPWQNHEWLADVFFYLWTRVLGVDGLVIWQWLVVGVAYLLLFRQLLRRTAGDHLVAYLLTTFALLVAAPFYDARPHLWTVLGFVLLIRFTVVDERPPMLLPLLFLLWMNLHGGAVFGLMAAFVTLAAWALFGDRAGEDAAPARRQRIVRAAVLFGASCLVTLVNPYGIRAWTYPLSLASRNRSATRTLLSEWRPPFAPGDLASPLLPWAIALFAVAALVLLVRGWRGDRRRAVAALGLGLLTLAMALQSRRFVPLFATALALAAAQAWSALRGGAPRRRAGWWQQRPLVAAALPLVLLLVASWRLAAYPLGRRAFDPLAWASRMPVDAVTFLQTNGLRGNVFAYYLWGGYLHWRTGGALRVHFDPRSETLFSDATIQQHARVARNDPGAEAIVERSPADFVLWPLSSPAFRGLVQQLQSAGWRPLYRDGVSILLARATVKLPDRLLPTPDSAYRSWALGRQALDEGRLADGAAQLEHALAQDPQLWPACQELAVAYATQGDAEHAHATVRRCRAIFPDLQLDVVDELLSGQPPRGDSPP
ncbi:MAG TPA: hypothetical protein VGS57_14170 [Thermoanaerobaculia bacterium]|jgi:hypothetical protein|nr:hypothetical protein [Thermoanaerobaculia bacterium]